MRIALPIALLLLIVTGAVPAEAAMAPGRVVFSVGAPEPQKNVDAAGASAAVALPDGGALLIAPDAGRRLVAARIRSDGSLQRGFGRDGIAHVRLPLRDPPASGPPGRPFTPLQALAQPDGRLIVVGMGLARTRLELPQMILVRLRADGALDRTFGQDGVAQPGLQASCGGFCHPGSIQADGSIVVTGNTGGLLAPPTGPDAPANFQWVVARLTPAGALDPSFGPNGLVAIPSVPGMQNGGFGAALLGDGRIVALGRETSSPLLTRLLPTGAPDPSFHGGVPAPLPIPFTLNMALHPDGFVDVLGQQRLLRYRSDGEPDLTFGAGGAVDLPAGGDMPRLLPLAARAVLIYTGTGLDPRPAQFGDLVVRRIAADGSFDSATGGASGLTLTFGFGGGVASPRVPDQPAGLGELRQTSFRTAEAMQRADGSLLVAGAVRVVRYTGEGAGLSTGRFAVGATTPALTVDRRFGGPASRPRLDLRVIRQRARTSARLGRVALRARASGPGLAFIRVRARGRVIARGVEPLFAEGRTTIRLPTTAIGERLLRRRTPLRLTVTARWRDLLAQQTVVRTRATLQQ
jgi:uncharacterized delta-60 repeat protein